VEEVPKDTYLRSRALAVQDVLNRMERAGTHLNFLVLDACRSKPSRMERSTRSAPTGLSEMRAPAGSVIAFACAPGKTALDGEGTNGVFTSHLLRHIRTPGLDVDELLRLVSGGVFTETSRQQDPFHNHNLKIRRVCLLDGLPPASSADAPAAAPATLQHSGSSAAVQLAAFLAHCDLSNDVGPLGAALDAAGVHKESDLQYMDKEVIAGLEVSPVIAKKLTRGLETYAPAGGANKAAPAAAPSGPPPRLAAVVGTATAASRIEAAKTRCDWAAVVAEMTAAPNDTAVLEAAATALIDGTANKPAEKMSASAAGAVAALSDMLRKHGNNESCCTNAAWALANVSISGAEEHSARAAEAGTIELLVAAVKRHAKAAQLLQFAWLALSRIVADNPPLKRRAGTAGAIEAAVAALKEHRSNAEVVSSVLDGLGPLVREPTTGAKASSTSGIWDVMVAAMRALAAEGPVQASAGRMVVSLVRNAADEARAREAAAKAGVLEALVAAMKAHATDVAVQEFCCWGLSTAISNSADNKRRADAAGAVAATMAALSTHAHDSDVQENALMALSALMSDKAAAAKLLASGAGEVVAALRRCEHNRIVQHAGCETLVRAAMDNSAAKLAFGEAGAVEAAFAALKIKDDESVQDLAAQLLAVLTSEKANAARCHAARGLELLVPMARDRAAKGDSRALMFQLQAIQRCVMDDAPAKLRAGDAGAVEAALAGVRAFTAAVKDADGASALDTAMLTLSTLVSENPNAHRAIRNDVFAVLVAAMKCAPSAAPVQEYGCTAVIRIVGEVNSSAEAAVLAGLITSILNALRTFPKDSTVQYRGLWALNRLIAQFPTGRSTQAGASGALALCLAPMRAHGSNADVCENALAVLAGLCAEDAANATALNQEKDGVSLTVGAMKAHPAQKRLQLCGAVLLVNTTANNPTGKAAAGKAGALPVLVAALRAHSRGDAMLAERAAKAMGNMLNGDTGNVKLAASAGAVQPLVDIMSAHPTVESVQENACKALTLLCDVAVARTAAKKAGAEALARAAKDRFKAATDLADWATRLVAKCA
jgi:hypothetical protein